MTREEAVGLISHSSLSSSEKDLLLRKLAISARIRLEQKSEPGGGVFRSHFGGLPWVPQGFEWPRWDRTEHLLKTAERKEAAFRENPRAFGYRDAASKNRLELSRNLPPSPLMFLAQLSMNELHGHVSIEHFPKTGSLAFFYHGSQPWGFDPADKGCCRVIYFPDNSKLAPIPKPTDTTEEDDQFNEMNARFEPEWTIPSSFFEKGVRVFSCHSSQDFKKLRANLCGTDKPPIHRFGGYPQEVQGEMQVQCQLVTNGIYCGNSTGYKSPEGIALRAGASDWKLILQIDSDDDLGIMWGDCGTIYFWMRSQDIVSHNFDAAWLVFQCC